MRAANDLASYLLFGKPYSELSSAEKDSVLGKKRSGQWAGAALHLSSGLWYEDFIEDTVRYPPMGSLPLKNDSGIFKTLCEDAQKDPAKSLLPDH
jgi:hypothetical protein